MTAREDWMYVISDRTNTRHQWQIHYWDIQSKEPPVNVRKNVDVKIKFCARIQSVRSYKRGWDMAVEGFKTDRFKTGKLSKKVSGGYKNKLLD